MLTAKVRDFIEARGLLSAGDAVVVGVSGGPDSLALLHVLCRLRGDLDFSIYVAHLNHMIRPGTAERDSALVEHIAAQLGLTFILGTVDVPNYAAETGMSLEEAGRQARYAFLFQGARSVGAGTVAVGHNADDQMETVAMHWIRGTGLAGLRGMRPLTYLRVKDGVEGFVDSRTGVRYPIVVHEDPAEISLCWAGQPRKRIARPLLCCFRSEIEDYCRSESLETATDESNISSEFFRNRIRMELVPSLMEYNPRFKELTLRSADILADDYAYIMSHVSAIWPRVAEVHEEFVRLQMPEWRELPIVIRRYLVREAGRCIAGTARNIEWKHVAEVLDASLHRPVGSRVDLPEGLAMLKEYRSFVIGRAAGLEDALRRASGLPLLMVEHPLPVPAGGAAGLPETDWVLETQVGERSGDKQLPTAGSRWEAHLDYDLVGGDLWLRRRRPGDVFRPLGMRGRKSLQDFMVDGKIEPWLRDYVPLLVSAGRILWVVGWRIDEDFKITADTRRVLRVTVRRAGEGRSRALQSTGEEGS